MITLMFVISIVLMAFAGRALARAIVVPRMQIKAHLRELEDYGFTTGIAELDGSLSERLRVSLRTRALALGGFLRRTVPALPVLEKPELSAAGLYSVEEDLVHGYRAILAVGLPLLMFLLLVAGGPMTASHILLLVLSVAGGWELPAFIIRKRGSKRLDDVERALPELLDLLIATIEAGMGFAAALNLVSERIPGALGEELRLTMREQSLGMSMAKALEQMAERCDTSSMRAFVRTAARGESLGTSIGPVLRELSSDQRRRRRMAAREKMQKAPIKMLFPVMFLIFPALMIVLMYPAAYSVMKNLPGF